ncbi:uncharacterized protein VTP21DRAFT_11208 [Calcarisporiella thermophila]|uniref:uncharacterized protein n=1 Tax=Calcarisporiella thermophila TaxID=911321 RepID=UPI003743B6A8
MSQVRLTPRIPREISLGRFKNFISPDAFGDVNLFSVLYKHRTNSPFNIDLSVYSVPELARISFEEAVKQEYHPTRIGARFGPTWSTHWFRVNISIPDDWASEPVWLLWDSSNEVLIWSAEGIPLAGLTGTESPRFLHREFQITSCAKGGEKLTIYVEMACNGMFGAGASIPGIPASINIQPPDENKFFTLDMVDLVVPRLNAWDLLYDFDIVRQVAQDLPADHPRSAEAIVAAHEIINSFDVDDPITSIPEARKVAHEFLSATTSERGHRINAIGNCHIDTAWLWPYDETKRKIARSFARQLRLMEQYPEFKFTASQAQQFEWLDEHYPALFAQVKEMAKAGKFLPIGGFPNTSFYWVGLDGSKVLTHMAPGETYEAQCTVQELLKSVRNNRDKEYSRHSLLLFGNGDGGGGALPGMLERLRRLQNLDPLPRVEIVSVDEFFERLEKESRELVAWKGELYFELHRGTYTTHGHIKWFNRKIELLLRDAEFIATILSCKDTSHNYEYPRKELERLWKIILLNQFHDVLPGSSIELVYKDARRLYHDALESGTRLRHQLLSKLLSLSSKHSSSSVDRGILVLNTLSWPRTELVRVRGIEGLPQYSTDGKEGYALINAAVALGSSGINNMEIGKVEPVHVEETEDGVLLLQNMYIAAKFDLKGRLISLKDLKIDRELIVEGKPGNIFKIFEDIPLYWDAWDVEIYHMDKYREVFEGHIQINERGPLRASLELTLKISEHSSIKQLIVLTAISRRLDFETVIDWNENRKFLATYETQFGHIERPTHFNTTWDAAKFEVCAHKYADLSEYGYGVALFNDCKYGYATHGNTMRLSLLRSPKAPDANSDIGRHFVNYAVYPHEGHFMQSDVVKQAYQFNVPLLTMTCPKEVAESITPTSYFSIHGADNILLETVKMAEDSQEVILRLYEAYGGKAVAYLKSALPVKRVSLCNIMEDEEVSLTYTSEQGIKLMFKPFELLTLKLVVKD